MGEKAVDFYLSILPKKRIVGRIVDIYLCIPPKGSPKFLVPSPPLPQRLCNEREMVFPIFLPRTKSV